MKINTSSLTGAALDWAVAKCEGGYDPQLRSTYGSKTAWQYTMLDEEDPERVDKFYLSETSYSTDWQLAGPIIERERISIRQWTNVPIVHAYMPVDGSPWASDGESPLIAAMRCYVASKLGAEVDMPEELL